MVFPEKEALSGPVFFKLAEGEVILSWNRRIHQKLFPFYAHQGKEALSRYARQGEFKDRRIIEAKQCPQISGKFVQAESPILSCTLHPMELIERTVLGDKRNVPESGQSIKRPSGAFWLRQVPEFGSHGTGKFFPGEDGRFYRPLLHRLNGPEGI